jgi:hypothetical protein
MRGLLTGGCLLLVALAMAASGCASLPGWTDSAGPPVPIVYDNPMLVPVRDPQQLWETVADVIDDYFRIKREVPIRVVGNTITEGRLDTFPEVASTLLEPWRHDSADTYEKVQSTLQSIRREAHVQVTPVREGFWIDVAVFKELEDVVRPAHASAGAATFRNDDSLVRVVSPVGEQDVNKDWIRMGRDRALEQRILAQLQERLGLIGVQPVPSVCPRETPGY